MLSWQKHINIIHTCNKHFLSKIRLMSLAFAKYFFFQLCVPCVCLVYVYETFDSHQWYFYWKENIFFASPLVILSKLFRLYVGNMGHGTIKDWASYMVMSYAIMNFRISFLEGSEGKFLGQNVVHANFHTSQTCIVGQ